jgi:beta-lactamase class A
MTAVSDNAYTSHIIERLTTEVINNTIKSLEWENTAAVLSGKTVLDA